MIPSQDYLDFAAEFNQHNGGEKIDWMNAQTGKLVERYSKLLEIPQEVPAEFLAVMPYALQMSGANLGSTDFIGTNDKPAFGRTLTENYLQTFIVNKSNVKAYCDTLDPQGYDRSNEIHNYLWSVLHCNYLMLDYFDGEKQAGLLRKETEWLKENAWMWNRNELFQKEDPRQTHTTAAAGFFLDILRLDTGNMKEDETLWIHTNPEEKIMFVQQWVLKEAQLGAVLRFDENSDLEVAACKIYEADPKSGDSNKFIQNQLITKDYQSNGIRNLANELELPIAQFKKEIMKLKV